MRRFGSKQKFRILKYEDSWLLLEPGFLFVACHRTDTFEEMTQDFAHILKSEQIMRRSR